MRPFTFFHLFLIVAALALFNPIQCAPLSEPLEPRDFSDDLRNFNRIVLLLHNIRSLIGVPISAISSPKFKRTGGPLELHPLDLAILPAGYCFNCKKGKSAKKQPPKDEMLLLDETQLIVVCAEDDVEHGFEWPMVQVCQGRERVLRDYLVDLRGRGSRLGVPRERIEKAPILKAGGYRCMPQDPEQTTCSSPFMNSSSMSWEVGPTGLNYQGIASSIYSQGRHALTSTSSGTKITPTTTVPVFYSRPSTLFRSWEGTWSRRRTSSREGIYMSSTQLSSSTANSLVSPSTFNPSRTNSSTLSISSSRLQKGPQTLALQTGIFSTKHSPQNTKVKSSSPVTTVSKTTTSRGSSRTPLSSSISISRPTTLLSPFATAKTTNNYVPKPSKPQLPPTTTKTSVSINEVSAPKSRASSSKMATSTPETPSYASLPIPLPSQTQSAITKNGSGGLGNHTLWIPTYKPFSSFSATHSKFSAVNVSKTRVSFSSYTPSLSRIIFTGQRSQTTHTTTLISMSSSAPVKTGSITSDVSSTSQ